MSLTPGTRLGVYEITALLGVGGMGEVYRATDTRLKRQVAIKILPPAVAADRDRLARFQREAEVLASLNHPNIAAIYGLEESEGLTALVMELVEGEDLSQRIARGAIPLDEALPIARQIADALEAAHERGIIHRDLKPANIKVRDDGMVKVLDFGLAKAMDPAGASTSGVSASLSPTMTSPAHLRQGSGGQATEMGMILGTAAYMSPEQARGKPVDKRADIWAFGVVLYEMLTGLRLFQGETVSDTLAAVLKNDPDLSLVPAHLRGLVGRCLERDPRKRLRDIGDLALLLDEGPSRNAPPIAKDRVRWFWLPAACAAAALLTWALLAMRGGTASQARVVFSELPPPGNRFVGAPIPSPDGKRLAIVATDGTGTARLWMRDLDDAAAQAIVGTEGIELGMAPFWSPDGQQIAFRAQGQVWRVTPGGRPAVVVVADPISGAWLNGGDLLLAIGGKGLMRVPSAGGALRNAPGFTSEDFSHLQIEGLDVSPDGNNLLFRQFGGETGVYVAKLADGTRRLLFPGEQNAAVFAGSDLIVRADGRGLVAQRFDPGSQALVGEAFPVTESSGATDFSASASGALTFLVGTETRSLITWFTRQGRPDGVVGPEGVHQEVAISRDGRLLAFSKADPADGNVDVWVQPLSGGAPRRLTSDADIDHRLVVAPDACCVAWESHAQGALNLVERPVDGSSPARLIRTWGRAGGAVDWSVDGRFILFESADGPSGSNLWAVPRDGKGEPTRITQPGFGAGDGQFSPDGRHLALTGRETGGTEIYVQRVDGMKLVGGPTRVSESGGRSPHWGRDGAELYFVNGATIFVAPFQATGDRPAGTPRALFTIAGFGGAQPEFRNFAAMPDGQRFVALVSVADVTPHPATVILNWRASLAETR